MKKLTSALVISGLLSTAMWAAPAFAADMGKAKDGSGEGMRAAPLDGEYKFSAKPAGPPKMEAGEENRAAPIDEKAAVEAVGTLTRSADGKVTRNAASDAVRGAVMEEIKKEEGKGTQNLDKAEDPSFAAEDASRQVFGDDDRVQVSNTKVYPFTAIGYIEGKSKTGYGGCSGTLIGPKTVLTAAHCLYNHEDKDWLADIIFAPGLNTFENAPYGAFKAESVTILEGFVKNYQGYYGSVVPWDLGIITLSEPVGDTLGYFGYANYEGLGDFDANIVGYPGDKPAGTMWRATCQVSAENVGTENFAYDCDTYPGSSGSSVYAYDNAQKARIVVGVNVAESPDANTAVRLNATYVQWINGLWQ